eukprot:GHVU01228663.1.p1 GENE.GHVU01228663.1~~GHVU01228663.1.p1  ORF type:complete len:153 (-),score=23.99 GHVU01228663.1:328-786(-)
MMMALAKAGGSATPVEEGVRTLHRLNGQYGGSSSPAVAGGHCSTVSPFARRSDQAGRHLHPPQCAPGVAVGGSGSLVGGFVMSPSSASGAGGIAGLDGECCPKSGAGGSCKGSNVKDGGTRSQGGSPGGMRAAGGCPDDWKRTVDNSTNAGW